MNSFPPCKLGRRCRCITSDPQFLFARIPALKKFRNITLFKIIQNFLFCSFSRPASAGRVLFATPVPPLRGGIPQ